MQLFSLSISTSLLLVILAAPLGAQEAPRPKIVQEGALQIDPGSTFYARARNLFDVAQGTEDRAEKLVLYVQAGDLFRAYLEEFPNHKNTPAAAYYAGSSFYQAGRVEDGKRFFRALLANEKSGPFAAAAAYTLAVDAYNQKRFAEAAPLFEFYAENSGKSEDRPRGYILAGRSYRSLARNKQAVEAYRIAEADPAAGPFREEAQLAIGYINFSRKEFKDALISFQKVADSKGATKYRGEAALNTAITAKKLDKPELATKYLNFVLNEPGMEQFRPAAQVALMESFYKQGSFKEVLQVFKQSDVKATGEKEAARLMLAGQATMKLKQPNAARKLFREVERLAKPQSDLAFQAAYYRLNCFFQIEGRHVPDQVDAFLSIYAGDRADDPRVHTAMLLKAESLFSEKKIEEASRVYAGISAKQLNEANLPGFYYKSGWVFAEAGNPQGAIRSLSTFIKKYPEDDRVDSALVKRAKSYVAVGKPDSAMKDFNRLIETENVSQEILSYAWLESARTRRKEGDIEHMLTRYQGVLKHAKDLGPNIDAEANYWIGLALVKSNRPKEAPPFLKKAREIRPKAYSRNAGVLLALSYFSAQDPENLQSEIKLAIAGDYLPEIPVQALQWSGMQAYNSDDFETAAEFLKLASNPDEPRTTPKEIWRYMAKSLIASKDAKAALPAVKNLLEVEEDPAWKADGLLDQARAYLILEKFEEARTSADQALELRPGGRTSAGLRVISGDLDVQEGELGKAAAHYLYVIQFHEDDQLKPMALHKLVGILEKQEKPAEARKFKAQLKAEFPDWKAP